MTTKSINIVLLQYTNLAWENFNTQIIPFLSRVMKPVLADEHQIQQKQLAVSRIMLDTVWNITFSAEIMFMQTIMNVQHYDRWKMIVVALEIAL